MMKPEGSSAIRALFVVGGIIFLVITAGFFWQMDWATALWPWPDGRLSYIFLASIAAAIAVYYLFVNRETRPWPIQGGG